MLATVVALLIVGLIVWRLAERHAPRASTGSSGQAGAGQRSSAGHVDIIEETDIRYGPAPLEVLDVYMNKDGSSQPAVVMVHGGGWNSGDKSQVAQYADTVAEDGFTVFNVDYPLASASHPGYPMEVDDLEAAVRWVISNGARYNADGRNLELVGGSAGAQLVDVVGPLLNEEQAHTVSAVVSLSAPTDFPRLIALSQQAARVGAGRGKEADLIQLFGCDVLQQATCAAAAERADSPALIVTAANCPSYLIFNSRRELVPLSQAEEFDSTLQRLGCQPQMDILPGRLHAFKYFSAVQTQIEQFLKAH